MDVKLEDQICKMSLSEFKLKTNIVELIKDDIRKNKPSRYDKELRNIDSYVNQVLLKYKESKKYRAIYNKKIKLVLATNTNILNKPMPASVRENLKRKLQINSGSINIADSDKIFDKTKEKDNKNAQTPTKSNNSPYIRKKLKPNKVESSCNPATPLELDSTNQNKLHQMETASNGNGQCSIKLVNLDSNISNNAANFSKLSVTDIRKLTLENYSFIRKFKSLCYSMPLDKTSSLRSFANCGGSSLLNKLKEYYKNEFFLKRTWPKELRVKLLKLKQYIETKLYLKTFGVQDIPSKFFTFEDLGKHTNFLNILAKLDTEFTSNLKKNEDVKKACYEWFVENDKLLQNLIFNEDFFEETDSIKNLKKADNVANLSNLFENINLQNMNGTQFELSRISLNEMMEHSNIREIVKNSIENVFQAEVLSSDVIEKYCQILYIKICRANSFPRSLTLNAKFIFKILPKTLIKNVNVTTNSYYNDVNKSKSSSDSELIEGAECDFINSLFGDNLKSTQETNSISLLNEANVNCTVLEKDNSATNMSQLESHNSKDMHTHLSNTTGIETDIVTKKMIYSDVSQSYCSFSRENVNLIIKNEPDYSQYDSEVIFMPNSPNQEIVIDDDESKVVDLLKEMFEFGASQSDCFDLPDPKT